MVERVSRISSTASSQAARVDRSISLAEPDLAWAAERQSVISKGLERHRDADPKGRSEHNRSNSHEGSLSDRLPNHPSATDQENDRAAELNLSGESERIGSGNLEDADVPFGDHVGYI
jgi:hypothetical protein